MLQPCQDNYSKTFASYEGMRRYHEKESLESRWHRCRVNELHIEPLDKASPLYGTPSAFAAGISAESVEDTAENLGLAMRVDGSYYPVRSTAYKSPMNHTGKSSAAACRWIPCRLFCMRRCFQGPILQTLSRHSGISWQPSTYLTVSFPIIRFCICI